jgi:hypothetical protein
MMRRRVRWPERRLPAVRSGKPSARDLLGQPYGALAVHGSAPCYGRSSQVEDHRRDGGAGTSASRPDPWASAAWRLRPTGAARPRFLRQFRLYTARTSSPPILVSESAKCQITCVPAPKGGASWESHLRKVQNYPFARRRLRPYKQSRNKKGRARQNEKTSALLHLGPARESAIGLDSLQTFTRRRHRRLSFIDRYRSARPLRE